MIKSPKVTVDVVLREKGRILLVKRAFGPYKGYWALPGGYIEYGETAEDAARREIKEETGLDVKIGKVLGVYSDPGRDPRGHQITIVYEGRREKGELAGSKETMEVKMWDERDLPKLAFDHKRIIGEINGP